MTIHRHHLRLLLVWIAALWTSSAPLIAEDAAPQAQAAKDGRTPVITKSLTRSVSYEVLQNADGSWDDGVPVGAAGAQGAARKPLNADLCTGLVTLLLLDAGFDHRTPSVHQQAVLNGLHWILREQGRGGPSSLAAAAVQSIVLSEASFLTNDAELVGPCHRALAGLLERRVHPPGHRNLLAWADRDGLFWARSNALCIAALQSAEFAGMNPAKDGFDDAAAWLDGEWNAANPGNPGHETGMSSFPAALDLAGNGGAADRPDPTSALVAAVFVGAPDDGPMRCTLANAVAAQGAPQAGSIDYAELWLRCLGMSMEKDRRHWQAWAGRTRQQILAGQITSGALTGMWSAADRPTEPALGPVSATACATLALEVFDRHAIAWSDKP